MKKMKKVLAVALSLVMAGSLAACGSSTETKAPETGASETAAESTAESGSEAASEVSTDGKVYNIGICQLIQHDALDAATKGFEDALTEVFGDNVKFDEQNAQGDSATCATIINGFVSNNDDLILANATAALQAAAAGTDTIPILGTSVTDYGVALDIDNFDGTVGGNISGTADLAPLDLGVATGKMAAKVLQGEDISTMPIEYAPTFTKEYVASRCEAYGITVPDDYVALEE